MSYLVTTATAADAPALVALKTAVAGRLTRDHGRGNWSSPSTEKGTLRSIESSRVLVARGSGGIGGMLRLATKRPWAISPGQFTSVPRALYLLDMAVAPDLQRQGVGRHLLEAAAAVTRAWPADAIRLDAYDGPPGAGAFYTKCGFREVGRITYRGVPLVYFELVL